MATVIEKASTITAKGQTTVPKAVRQALGVDYGGKIVYRIEDGRVTVNNSEAEHRDPAVGTFLRLLEKDIAAGHHVRDLPAGLTSAMRRAAKDVRVNLEEELEGDVEL
jgi:antitoxin PrlF